MVDAYVESIALISFIIIIIFFDTILIPYVYFHLLFISSAL